MRSVFSPGERRVLRELEPYPLELAFVLELIDAFDAHLAPEEEPPRVHPTGSYPSPSARTSVVAWTQ